MELDKILAAQRAWQVTPAEDTATAQMAAEALTTCAESIAVLSRNLHEIGYPWAGTQPIAPGVLERSIRTIEETTGAPVPQILALFWEKIGGVSFVDLNGYRHVRFWESRKVRGPNGFCDGLHLDACTEEWASFVCDEFLDWQEYASESDSEPFLLSLSPDGYHKDDISGGDSYGVVPGSAWKPVWANFEWSGARRPVTALADPPDFLSYLRTTLLECAGFPGLFGVPAFEPIRERLLQGVPVF